MGNRGANSKGQNINDKALASIGRAEFAGGHQCSCYKLLGLQGEKTKKGQTPRVLSRCSTREQISRHKLSVFWGCLFFKLVSKGNAKEHHMQIQLGSALCQSSLLKEVGRKSPGLISHVCRGNLKKNEASLGHRNSIRAQSDTRKRLKVAVGGTLKNSLPSSGSYCQGNSRLPKRSWQVLTPKFYCLVWLLRVALCCLRAAVGLCHCFL